MTKKFDLKFSSMELVFYFVFHIQFFFDITDCVRHFDKDLCCMIKDTCFPILRLLNGGLMCFYLNYFVLKY